MPAQGVPVVSAFAGIRPIHAIPDALGNSPTGRGLREPQRRYKYSPGGSDLAERQRTPRRVRNHLGVGRSRGQRRLG